MPIDPVAYLKRLSNSAERKAKGDDGDRSTRDIADACGLTAATARRSLWKAVD